MTGSTRPALTLPHKLSWAAQARLMAAYAAECQSAAQQAQNDGLSVLRADWLAEAGRADAEARKFRAIKDAERGSRANGPAKTQSNGHGGRL